MEDSTVILAVPNGGSNLTSDFQDILEAALGDVVDNNECITTTSTTTAAPAPTTTTTSTLQP
jgi:hypothetical protein